MLYRKNVQSPSLEKPTIIMMMMIIINSKSKQKCVVNKPIVETKWFYNKYSVYGGEMFKKEKY